MPNEAQIRDLATVRTGYTFRTDGSGEARSGLLGLQIRDIRRVQIVDSSQLSSVEWHGSGDPPILAPNDLVLAAKGERNFAALFVDHEALVVPSSQLLVLSVKNERETLPAFLCWILNFEPTQRRLAEYQTGTKIPSLSKKALLDVVVPVPPIETQQAILHLQSLRNEEHRLVRELETNRDKMLHGVYQELLNGASE